MGRKLRDHFQCFTPSFNPNHQVFHFNFAAVAGQNTEEINPFGAVWRSFPVASVMDTLLIRPQHCLRTIKFIAFH